MNVTIEQTMIYEKMLVALTGLGGAYCKMCDLSEAECQNPEVAVQGFVMNRTMTDVQDLWELLGDGEGKKEDY